MWWNWSTRERRRPAITIGKRLFGKIHGCLVRLLAWRGRVGGGRRWTVILACATKLGLGWATNTDAGLTTVTEWWELWRRTKWCWGELSMTEWGERRTMRRMYACCSRGRCLPVQHDGRGVVVEVEEERKRVEWVFWKSLVYSSL
jgi:hypothetical protein